MEEKSEGAWEWMESEKNNKGKWINGEWGWGEIVTQKTLHGLWFLNGVC